MKKFISALLIASMSIGNISFAYGFDISPDPPDKSEVSKNIPPVTLAPGEKDPGKALSPMKKGQKAPFTGVLLSPAAVADIIVELDSIEERIQIEVMNATKLNQAECEKKVETLETNSQFDKKMLQATIENKDKNIASLTLELQKSKKEQTNPFLWTGIGLGAGILMTVLTAYAISQTTK